MTWHIKTKTPFVVIGVVMFVVVAVRVIYPRVGPPLIINYTPSEPRGLYWIEPRLSTRYQRGQMVIFPVPMPFKKLVYGRQWLAEGLPLMKSIGALEGDEVCITDQRATINQRVMGNVWTVDSEGRAMPALRGCFTVPAGAFFPLSTSIEKSFDGRYIGFQPLTSIAGEVHPLWTF